MRIFNKSNQIFYDIECLNILNLHFILFYQDLLLSHFRGYYEKMNLVLKYIFSFDKIFFLYI